MKNILVVKGRTKRVFSLGIGVIFRSFFGGGE